MSRTAMDGILMAIVLGTITHFTRPDGFGLLVIIIGLCAAYLVIRDDDVTTLCDNITSISIGLVIGSTPFLLQ